MENIDIGPNPAIPISIAIRVMGNIHPITDILLMDSGIIINIIINPNAGY
jgi:hypothetical protein